MNKVYRCAVGVLFVGMASVHAEDVPFPSPSGDGSHDLASPAAWNVPSAADFADKTAWLSAGGLYTASNDVTMAGILTSPNSGRQAFELDMRNETTGANPGPRIVNLTGTYRSGGSHETRIRGGLWNLNGNNFNNPDGSFAVVGNAFEIGDGAVLTNVTDFYGGSFAGGASMLLTGGSRLYAKTLRVGYFYDLDGLFEVSGGSQIVLDGGSGAVFYSDLRGSANNRFSISGESVLKVLSGDVVWGYWARDNVMTVSNATVEIANALSIGSEDVSASNNVVCVRKDGVLDVGSNLTVGKLSRNNLLHVDGGEVRIGGYLAQGNEAGSEANVLRVENGGTVRVQSAHYMVGDRGARAEILSGGTLQANGFVFIGGDGGSTPDSVMVISNGICRAPSFPAIGNQAGATNCCLQVVGRASVLDFPSVNGLFRCASGCRIVLDDFAWTNNVWDTVRFSDGYGTHHCRLELVNGAELVTDKDFYMASLAYAAPSNVTYVGAGCTLAAKSILLNSFGNEMVVSNGLVKTHSNEFSLEFDGPPWNGGNTNGCLTLQGSCPRIRVPNHRFNVNAGSCLRFELPVGGYDEGTPIEASWAIVDETSRLEFLNADDYAQSLEKRTKKTLIEVADTLTIAPGVLERANAALPKSCSIAIDSTGKRLVLTARPDRGFVLLVK